MQKLVKRPLETYEETRNDTNFDAYRNVLKCLIYLVSVFVEEETKNCTGQKGINDLRSKAAKNNRKKNKEEMLNFLTTINKINALLD